MKKIILILLALSTSAFCGEPDIAFHEKCVYPSVMIEHNKEKTVGTGFIVKSVKKDDHYENYVFTCAHNVKSKKSEINIKLGIYENWSTLVGYRESTCEVLVVDLEKDLCLLRFKTEKETHCVEIEKCPKLYIGNDICKVGCGFGESFRIDFGKITSLKDSIGSNVKNKYRISAATVAGDSGGLVAHENKVFGIVYAMHTSNNFPVYHMSYVIPITKFYESEQIVEYLKDV